jgi:hypothetical protein
MVSVCDSRLPPKKLSQKKSPGMEIKKVIVMVQSITLG